MNDVAKMLLIVLAVDLFLMLGSLAITEQTSDVTFFDSQGQLLSQAGGNYTVFDVDKTGLNVLLPESTNTVDTDTDGNVFTDLIKSTRNWFLDTAGFGVVDSVVNAFPNFIKSIGLPKELSFALGAIWHIFTVFLIVLLIWGRT